MTLLLEFDGIEPCYRERGDYAREETWRATRVGGARGEVARGITEDVETANGAISSRFETATIAMLGDDVASTEPVVEQTAQI